MCQPAMYAIPMMANPGVRKNPSSIQVESDKRTEAEKMKGHGSATSRHLRKYRAKGGLIGFAPDRAQVTSVVIRVTLRFLS